MIVSTLNRRQHLPCGRGANKTTLSGNRESSILELSDAGDSVVNLTDSERRRWSWRGGIYCVEASVVLKDMIINGCQMYPGSIGGAIFSSSSNITMINTLISNNVAARGGGVLDYGSSYFLTNVTMAADSVTQDGGAFYCIGGTNIVLVNSILWDNSTHEIYCYSSLGNINVAYSDLKGGVTSIVDTAKGAANWSEGTNINSDPEFRNGFHLGDSSQCIGKGTNGFQINGVWIYPPNEDLDHNPRPSPQSSMSDMGAYENSLGKPLAVVSNEDGTVKKFGLSQNFPNPFNPSTVIGYQLPVNTMVTLKIYDVLGRDVQTLVNERQTAGSYSVTFNAATLPSGVYFYRLEAGTYTATKKLLLLK